MKIDTGSASIIIQLSLFSLINILIIVLVLDVDSVYL